MLIQTIMLMLIKTLIITIIIMLTLMKTFVTTTQLDATSEFNVYSTMCGDFT
jgi:hypothetical protein